MTALFITTERDDYNDAGVARAMKTREIILEARSLIEEAPKMNEMNGLLRWMIAVAGGVCISLVSSVVHAETWTDSTGNFKIEAEFVGESLHRGHTTGIPEEQRISVLCP